MNALPIYQCHKQVRAMKIGRIEGCTLYPADESLGLLPVEVSADYISRHPLNQPGYYVLYEDGYASFSPQAAFESGYTAARESCFAANETVVMKVGGPMMSVVGYVEGSEHMLVAEWMNCAQSGWVKGSAVFDDRTLRRADQ